MPYPAHIEDELHNRAMALKLMGFNVEEIETVLENEFRLSLTRVEAREIYKTICERLAASPELQEIKSELGEAWGRMQYIRQDMLAIYQNLVTHFNAHLEGKVELPNGKPVIAVRVSDLISVADKVIRIDEGLVTSKLNAIKMLPALEAETQSAPVLPNLSEFKDELTEDSEEDSSDEDVVDADYKSSEP